MREYLSKKTNQPAISSEIAVAKDSCRRCQAGFTSIVSDALGRYLCRECGCDSDMILYRYPRVIDPGKHSLELKFKLTARQQRGSDFVSNCFHSGHNGFLQAICGAGKTEMALAAILEAMNQGIRVGFAIPRKQIVIQLTGRLKKYFPNSVVKAIHGDAKDDQHAHIVVMTIQQLINFKDEFGLLFIDEVDAFPFAGSPFYWRTTLKAMKDDGTLILISATLNSRLRLRLKKLGFRFHFNPARFHEVDHDLPRFLQIPSHDLHTLIKTTIPILQNWRLLSKPAIIFLPSISECVQIASLLRKEGFKATAISSKTEHKEAIIARFMVGDTDILVSTSIMERGITFPNLQVAVLKADNPLFDRDTLIQMCGRVGRDQREAHGEIWFVSEYLSPAMRKARAMIKAQNRAKANGDF